MESVLPTLIQKTGDKVHLISLFISPYLLIFFIIGIHFSILPSLHFFARFVQIFHSCKVYQFRTVELNVMCSCRLVYLLITSDMDNSL